MSRNARDWGGQTTSHNGSVKRRSSRVRMSAVAWTALLVLGVFISTPILAAGNGVSPEAETSAEPLRLSLGDAVKWALDSNVTLLLDAAAVDAARTGLEQVRALSLIEPSPTLLLQTEAGLELAKRNLALSEQRVAFEVEAAYYDVLRLHNVLHVLDDALKMAERQLEVAQSRHRTGVATENDVLKARTALMQLEADRADAADGLSLLWVRLRQMLGVSPGTPLQLDEAVITHEPVAITLDEALSEAVAQRIELAQVKLAVELAERELELADNDYTPELTRVQAELELEQARLRRRQAEDGIALDVHNAYNEMRGAYRRLALAEQRLLEMEEDVRIIRALFDARMATDVELLQGQTGLTEARTATVNAVFDYNAARATFFQAIAREFERR